MTLSIYLGQFQLLQQIYHRLDGLKNRNLILALEAGKSKIKGLADSVPGSILFLVCRIIVFLL